MITHKALILELISLLLLIPFAYYFSFISSIVVILLIILVLKTYFKKLNLFASFVLLIILIFLSFSNHTEKIVSAAIGSTCAYDSTCDICEYCPGGGSYYQDFSSLSDGANVNTLSNWSESTSNGCSYTGSSNMLKAHNPGGSRSGSDYAMWTLPRKLNGNNIEIHFNAQPGYSNGNDFFIGGSDNGFTSDGAFYFVFNKSTLYYKKSDGSYTNATYTWWNTSWVYRNPITIDNTGSALSNYQVKITVPYEQGMNLDFSDLRFVDSNGTPLNYWIEDTYPKSCAQILARDPSATSGVYTIKPDGSHPFDVYCDITDNGGGWMLLDNFVSSLSGDSDPYGAAIGSSNIKTMSDLSNAGYTTYLTNIESTSYTRKDGYLQMYYSGFPIGYIQKTLPSYANEVYVKWGNWYSRTATLKIGGSTVQSLSSNYGAATYLGSYNTGDQIRFEENGIFWAGKI
ncbi:MAG: DUF2341 domain-containing protein [Nitrospiraceae bacterium]|nr:DUF2341 domain-containing protein [Nitrospiraceae bacterium]